MTARRTITFIIYSAILVVLLAVPYGAQLNQDISLIEYLEPDNTNNRFDPLFGFCLYAPVLLVLESFFIRLPLSRLTRGFLIVQLVAVAWSWLLIMLLSIGFMGGYIEIYWNAIFIQMWITYALVWNICILIKETSRWRWVGWLFDL